jgi:two-component system, NarL family, response regulator
MAGLIILIVDDHPVITFGVKALFEADGFAEVIECSDYRQTSMMLEKHSPDAVLFDLNMPRLNLERDFRHIKRKHPDYLFIAYTADIDEGTILRCKSLGFSGFIAKSNNFLATKNSILAVIDGKEVFPETSGPEDSPDIPLTGTQLNILRLLAAGHKNNEVAEIMGIRGVTVDYHKKNIRTLLEANTSAETIAIGKANGWI